MVDGQKALLNLEIRCPSELFIDLSVMDRKSPEVLTAARWIADFLSESSSPSDQASAGRFMISTAVRLKRDRFITTISSYISLEPSSVRHDSKAVQQSLAAIGISDFRYIRPFTVSVSSTVIANGVRVYPLACLRFRFWTLNIDRRNFLKLSVTLGLSKFFLLGVVPVRFMIGL